MAAPEYVLLITLLLAARGTTQAIQDSRCYLMNGGAVESFFISEDTPVGSVIGTLSVNGDPSLDGNISLSLQERNAGVGVAAGTKNVTLLRKLDREETSGPSNLYVNVRCDRRHTTDPSFIIPVSVRVWDVNDNAPQWIGAPYRVRLSELSAVGTPILPNIRATDDDQPGPHATIHYSVVPGPYSEYFGFVNELDSVLVVKKPLDYETLNNFTITLRAQDQGNPPLYNDTELTVEVLDADDQNPRFSYDHYTAVIPDDAQEGTILETSPGPITGHDQDIGINAPIQYSVQGDGRHLVLVDRDTGRVAVTRGLLDNVDLPVTVVIKAVQVDNPDRYALATLWLGRHTAGSGNARPLRFRKQSYTATVREDVQPGAVLLTLYTEPNRNSGGLQFYVSDRSFLEKFAINSAGEVILRKPLDYEANQHYAYQVMVTDGLTNDTASLTLTVENVNEWEPRFKYPHYEFRVDADSDNTGDDTDTVGRAAGLLPVGKLDVHDGDSPDTVTLTLRGTHANMFYINSSGEMYLRALEASTLNSSTLHLVATAVDSGDPPRQTSVPVVVHVGSGVGGGAGGRSVSAAGGRGVGGAVLVLAGGAAAASLLVCALLAYIYRNKRRSKSSSPSTKTSISPREKSPSPHHSPPHSGPPAPGGVGPGTGAGGTLASSGSLLSVSAGASTILANSSSSLDLRGDTLPSNVNGNNTSGRQSHRPSGKSKVAPAPPSAAVGDGGALSDHLRGVGGGGGRSGVAWPAHTIPARVKKLSWDDNDTDNHNNTNNANGKDSGPPATAPVHATNPALHDHMNLTVYF